MFGIGIGELIVIAIVALIFVGPQKLPEYAKVAGKYFVQFRRMTNDFRNSVEDYMHKAEEELRREEREALKKLLDPQNVTPSQSQAVGSADRSGSADAPAALPLVPEHSLSQTSDGSPSGSQHPHTAPQLTYLTPESQDIFEQDRLKKDSSKEV